jgi:hypothetical protein
MSCSIGALQPRGYDETDFCGYVIIIRQAAGGIQAPELQCSISRFESQIQNQLFTHTSIQLREPVCLSSGRAALDMQCNANASAHNHLFPMLQWQSFPVRTHQAQCLIYVTV